MQLTVQELLIDAMSLIGATAIDETPTTSELNLGLRVANMMIDRWSSMPLMLRSTDTLSFVANPGQAVYSIGEYGADINSKKPIKVFSGFVRDQGKVDYPLDIVDKSVYDSLQDKDISTGRPTMLIYDPMGTEQWTPYGNIILYYTPDQTYTVYFDCTRDVCEFEDLEETVDFEPIYYEALKYGIAVRLFRHFHAVSVPIPADLLKMEADTLRAIYSMNNRTILSASDFPQRGGKYNVYTDQGY